MPHLLVLDETRHLQTERQVLGFTERLLHAVNRFGMSGQAIGCPRSSSKRVMLAIAETYPASWDLLAPTKRC